MSLSYSKESYLKAKDEWDRGKFGWQWQKIRRLAAGRGFIFPPTGTRHDDRDADEPSQRAIIWRALEDNPTSVEAIVNRSRSWHEVVDGIIGLEARLSMGVVEADRDNTWRRKDEPNPRQSSQAIGKIFERIADSLGYVRKDEA